MKLKTISSFLLAVASACIPLPILAQSSQISPVSNRIVAPVDETSLVALKGNVHPLAQARFDRGVAPGSTPTGRLSLVLQPSATQQQALTQYLADLQNPSSPSFHKWLTPAQYGALYGISDADLQTVESWLESHGFKIEKVPAARNLIQFSGTFDAVQNAFHTSIHTFAVNGQNHVANVSDPEIPEALAPVVAGITALNDFRPKPMVKMGPKGHIDESTKTIVPDYTDTNGFFYVTPADAATIYDTPNKNLNANYSGTTYDGSGVNIGVAGDSNISMTDVTNYRTAFLGASSSSPNDPTVVIDGNDPGPTGTSDEIEALLDNEVAGGLAPGAKVYFYTSADSDLSSGLFNAILRAIDDNTVSILNISFGACEAAEGTGGNQYLNAVFEQAAAQGISVTVSTGDSGSAGCDDSSATAATQGFGVNAFASNPWTIAVGGTDYDTLATGLGSYVNSGQGSAPYHRTANKYIPENPWNDSTDNNTTYANNVADTIVNNGSTNIIAAGGGKSSCTTTSGKTCVSGYPKPSFQTSVTPGDSVRDLPDVSFLAGNGFYGAAWLVCSDGAISQTGSGVDCENTSGTLTSTATVTGVGGTSAAAPAFAGMLALVAQAHGSASDNYRLGQADYVLYQLAKSRYSTVFHDVTTGNNSVVCTAGSTDCGTNKFLKGYNAGTNYDYASGLGSVDVAALVSNWTSATLTGTSTSLEINNSTAAINVPHGTALTFKVGVTPTSATGPVAIIDTANETSGGTGSGPQNNGQFAITLSSGTGSATYNGLPGGTYQVSARYGGDASDASSTSTPPISVTIAKENSSTALQVNAYDLSTGNKITTTTTYPYGSQINLDASISGTSADEVANGTEGSATGTVTFKNGSTTLGSSPVTTQANEASWPPLSSQFTVLPAGSYSATAAYSGDPSFNASTSSAAAFTVAKATTATAASANPTTVSATGTSTVTVTITTPFNYGAAGYGSVPTGTVTLTENGNTLGTITSLPNPTQSGNNFVSTGTVTIQGSQLPSGSDTITATYSGDNNYVGSSGTFTVTGSGSGTGGGAAIALSNSGNITISPGATTGNTSTITVTPSGGFTGAVNLACNVTTTISNPTEPPTCSLGTGSSVTISGTKAATATLTVSTTAASSSALEKPLKKFFVPAGGAALAMVLFFGIPARRRAWRALFSLLAVIVVISAAGCGSSGGTKTTNPGTTAGAYTVTVTGTDAATGKITNSTQLSLTVN